MSIFTSEVKQQKFVGWLAKAATIVVSAPATISVAKQAYADVAEPMQSIVIAACVMLVECAFVFFWLKTEGSKTNLQKDAQLQQGYVFGAWFMFGVLLYAGFLHGEGLLTFLFRASMGLLLFISTRDRLVQTKIKLEEQFAKGEYKSHKLVNAQRRADEQVEMEQIKRNKQMRLELIRKDPNGTLQNQAQRSVGTLLQKQEQMLPKVTKKRSKTGPMETDDYKITKIDDQFEVSCKHCDFHMLKDRRKNAALAGNSHQKIHSNGNGHKKILLFSEDVG